MDASHPLMVAGWRAEWTLAGRRHQSAKREEQALRRQTGGSEMKTIRTVVGVDTAKRVFQLHWIDMETGEIVDLKLSRAKFLEHFANRAPCLVAMEACGGSHHWARRLQELGHEPRLLPAKAVRPFVRGKKTMHTMPRQSGPPHSGPPSRRLRSRARSSRRSWRCTASSTSSPTLRPTLRPARGAASARRRSRRWRWRP